jgi:hypothetical protein
MGLRLWCLTPLSTIFKLYRGSREILSVSRSTRTTSSIYCVFFVRIWIKQGCINFFPGKYIARFGFSISVLANTFHVWVFNFCARKYIARFDFQLLLTNYKSWKYTTCHVHSIYSCILKLFLTSILILEGNQIHMQLICISCLNYIWIKYLMYKNYKHVHK